MHIPDGFLSPPVWATLDVIGVPTVAVIARRAQHQVEEAKLPLLGVMGAFVFAAQMINFPVGLGTSGHLLGGTLLACLLGPAAATVVITAILIIQALVFQDGGILALGANVFNMAVCGVLAGSYFYSRATTMRARRAALFFGAVFSVLVSACLALAELLISGVPMRPSILAVSLALFAVSAVLEGAITVAVVEAITAINPRWTQAGERIGLSTTGLIFAASIFLAAVGVLFAASSPDGLEQFAHQMGWSMHAQALVSTPLADYEVAGLHSPWLRKAFAGLAGLVFVYGLCLFLGRFVKSRRRMISGSI